MAHKRNITQYSDSELSFLFQNIESLYNIWHKASQFNRFEQVKEVADELFEYRPEQLQELQNDFDAEVADEEFREGGNND